MSIYEFDSNGYRGLFEPKQRERKLLFPKATIFTTRNLLVVHTGYTVNTIPLHRIGNEPVRITIEGDYPTANGVLHGRGEFLIKKLRL